MLASPRAITVDRRLRPIRLAFLLKPNDTASLLRVLEVNTCLWGGCFNAIVPIYARTPQRFSDPPFRAPAARDMARGYLEAFEPDFIVDMADALAKGLGFPRERTLSISDVLVPGHSDAIGYGLSAIEVYRRLHRQVFQFTLRHPPEIISPVADYPKLEILTSACFGRFPSEPDLVHFANTYRETFSANEVGVDQQALPRLLTADSNYPLRVGAADIRVQGRSIDRGPLLFYMSATSWIDVVDLWNLRAWGYWAIPIPRQWQSDLTAWCADFARQVKSRQRGPSDDWAAVSLVCSRDTDFAEMEAFAQSLPGFSDRLPIALQHWYPGLWDTWQRAKGHIVRCDLSAAQGSVEIRDLDGGIAFPILAPSFASSYGGRGTPRWANVVNLREGFPSVDLAAVISPDQPQLAGILGTLRDRVWSTREGIVIACEHRDWSEIWQLPKATEIVSAWMQRSGFAFTPSADGLIASQLVRSLGGFNQARLVAHEDLLRKLNSMAHGEELLEWEDAGSSRRRARARSAAVEDWHALLRRVNGNHANLASNHLKALLEKGVLRLGLRVQCPQCSQHTWFDLPALSDMLRCERCVESFPFPAHDPSNADGGIAR